LVPRWIDAGAGERLSSGTIVVEQPTSEDAGRRTVAYCRVSSHDRRTDLERQAGRLGLWASEHGVAIDEVVTEVGSGLNGKRPPLARLLADPSVGTIVVEHRDRLARFGVEHLRSALLAQGRKIVVVDEAELDDDLVGDMTEVLTSFCARLYGRRGARNRALRALTTAKSAEPAFRCSSAKPSASSSTRATGLGLSCPPTAGQAGSLSTGDSILW